MKSEQKRLFNVEEAAQYIGLTPGTLYNMASRREIPTVKVGRALRFDVLQLDRFIEQHARKQEQS